MQPPERVRADKETRWDASRASFSTQTKRPIPRHPYGGDADSASCLVDWVAEDLVTEPIIEAVIVRFEGTKALSFVRPGRLIASVQPGE